MDLELQGFHWFRSFEVFKADSGYRFAIEGQMNSGVYPTLSDAIWEAEIHIEAIPD